MIRKTTVYSYSTKISVPIYASWRCPQCNEVNFSDGSIVYTSTETTKFRHRHAQEKAEQRATSNWADNALGIILNPRESLSGLGEGFSFDHVACEKCGAMPNWVKRKDEGSNRIAIPAISMLVGLNIALDDVKKIWAWLLSAVSLGAFIYFMRTGNTYYKTMSSMPKKYIPIIGSLNNDLVALAEKRGYTLLSPEGTIKAVEEYAKKDNNLYMVCPRCKKAFSSEVRNPSCPLCHNRLTSTGYTMREWDCLDENTKVAVVDRAMSENKKGSTPPSNEIWDAFDTAIKEATERRNQMGSIILAGQQPNREDFGYSPENPICTTSLMGTERYLKRLCTKEGKTFTWSGYSSVRATVRSIPDVGLDKYMLFLDGEKYAELFFVLYMGESEFPPYNLSFVDDMRDWDLERKALEQETAPDKFQSSGAMEQEKGLLNHISDSSPELDIYQYCRICGNKLLSDSIYCSKCGTKVKR